MKKPCLVFTLHFNYFADAKYGSVLKNFTEEFHIGVTLFFVLSGFLISLRYSDMINFNFKNYAINRIARIYPIYFILTTLTFLSYAVIKGQNRTTDLFIYLSNISFVRGFSSKLLFTGALLHDSLDACFDLIPAS